MPSTLRIRYAIPASILLLCALSFGAQARGGIDVVPFIGYRWGGEFEDANSETKLKLQDNPAFGVAVDFDYGKNGQIGFVYSHQSTEFRENSAFPSDQRFDLDIDYLQFTSMYLWDGESTRPFVTAGLGLTYMNPDRAGFNSTTRFSFSLGGGAKWYFTKNIGLRFEVRGYGTVLQSGTSVFCSGGCNIQITGGGFYQLESSLGLIVRF